ncbi:MAG: STAS domain-containing protein [Candidatus Tantalella remota]|nr:STAS domain-containing protein [Candidatus Tantalella remota]
MRIREQLDGDRLTLFLEGTFDEGTSPAVEEKLEEALLTDASKICFNMSKVDYLSSAGIRVMIIAHKKSIKSGKTIEVGEMSDKVQDVLEVVGILPLFGDPTR